MSSDFSIDFDGRWFHDGAEIGRAALVKLFAERALKVDKDGRYWLSTPFEKYPVEVADVPFLIVDIRGEPGGPLTAITNIGEEVALPAENPFEMRFNAREQMDLPYVHVRSGLYARLSRAVFYEWVERFGPGAFS